MSLSFAAVDIHIPGAEHGESKSCAAWQAFDTWHLHPERQRATSGAIRQKTMSLWGANP